LAQELHAYTTKMVTASEGLGEDTQATKGQSPFFTITIAIMMDSSSSFFF